MRRFLSAADRGLAGLERLLLGLAMAALVAIAVLVCWEIVARSLPAIAIPDGVILVQMLMVASIALALGHATGTGAHIAVDILYNLFPDRARRACDLLGLVAALVFMVPASLWIAGETVEHVASGRTLYGLLRLPEWPPYVALALGMLSMCLRLAHLLVRDLAAPDREAARGADEPPSSSEPD